MSDKINNPFCRNALNHVNKCLKCIKNYFLMFLILENSLNTLCYFAKMLKKKLFSKNSQQMC